MSLKILDRGLGSYSQYSQRGLKEKPKKRERGEEEQAIIKGILDCMLVTEDISDKRSDPDPKDKPLEISRYWPLIIYTLSQAAKNFSVRREGIGNAVDIETTPEKITIDLRAAIDYINGDYDEGWSFASFRNTATQDADRGKFISAVNRLKSDIKESLEARFKGKEIEIVVVDSFEETGEVPPEYSQPRPINN